MFIVMLGISKACLSSSNSFIYEEIFSQPETATTTTIESFSFCGRPQSQFHFYLLPHDSLSLCVYMSHLGILQLLLLWPLFEAYKKGLEKYHKTRT